MTQTPPAAPAQKAFLVEERPNPSTDYFVLPALSAPGFRVSRCGFKEVPRDDALQGAVVVFVRYIPAAWARRVSAMRGEIARVVLFMDDDVLDIHASAGTPLRYRLKLAHLAAWRKGWLRRQGAELWVSTRHLQQKYASWYPQLLLPSPLPVGADMCRVFYHGTASHRAEIRWLRPVMAAVLAANERIAFEIVGGADVNRLYRGLSRVSVVHPMSWPAYQAFLAQPGRDIGLAPLLDRPFNEARSCTKFFDITRCGAVGIYSRAGACGEAVRDGVDGVLASPEPEAWVDAILGLACDAPRRQLLRENALATMARLGAEAKNGSPALIRGEPQE